MPASCNTSLCQCGRQPWGSHLTSCDAWKATPLWPHTLTPTHTICSVDCTPCNSQADACCTLTHLHPLRGDESLLCLVSALKDGAQAWTLTCRWAFVRSAQACVSPPHRKLGWSLKTASFVEKNALFIAAPSLSRSLYQIIKPISHWTISGHQRQFLKKWLFCHRSLDSVHHMTNN